MSDVNLIPPQRVLQKRRKARLGLWTVVCGVYLAGVSFALSLAFYVWGGSNGDRAAELRSTTDRIKQYSASIMETRKDLAQSRLKLRTAKTVGRQPDWSTLLQVVAETLGDDIVLDQCRLTTLDREEKDLAKLVSEAATPPSDGDILADRRYALRLSGFSQNQSSVSLFVLRLERLCVFESVRLEKSRSQAFLSGLASAFSVECRF